MEYNADSVDKLLCGCDNENSKQLQRFGRTAAGTQRYRCLNCERTFTATARGPIPDHVRCPKCNSTSALRRAGKSNSKQRYNCKRCNLRFVNEKARRKKKEATAPEFPVAVINTVLGQRLSLKQAAKKLNIPYTAVRKLFLHSLRHKPLDGKHRGLSVSARIEHSKIKEMDREDLPEFFRIRGMKCAVANLRKQKNQAALERLMPLLNHYLS